MLTLIETRGLRLARSADRLLSPPDFSLEAGERLCLLGASGRGKTSLLHALLGFVPVHEGSLQVFGRERRSEADFIPLRGPLGLLFQDPADQLFGPTALEDVAFGPLNQGLEHRAAHALALETLTALGLERLAERPVQQLSGGEQRLVALAGVLAMKPRMLLLDEPSSGLDENACARLLACLLETGLPMLVASHDQELVHRLGTRTLSL
ncbi:cobalt ABC transporter ATP-binding protein [Stutzerimonas stutzeri]|uniref:Cobalt ABC transporter ATP-binding protein n=1 Tax=Stutzerimonas stutzeri TaxID=316 RepID=A0A2N8SXB6_STUST|nr:ABC transporter ATP-binding protein [Stutzerimonas stutzeri]MCQ4327107.1 energy-coupling factor ABC transporter ATP-binding protein [Stutzerimonas stutzeri]PNG07140.1 cobalt ABC transporter ATP-binding protein [Stutzerimonas stutzeri]